VVALLWPIAAGVLLYFLPFDLVYDCWRMSRALAIVASIALLAVGALLALYGLFLILYRGDSGGNGDTYVTFASQEIDADLAGGVSLGVALALTVASVVALRSRR
jgi:hypothetical protein